MLLHACVCVAVVVDFRADVVVLGRFCMVLVVLPVLLKCLLLLFVLCCALVV